MNRLLLLYVLLATVFGACVREDARITEPFDTDFHPVYARRSTAQRETAIRMFDSAYALLKKPGIYEQYKRLDFKQWYYKSRQAHDTALLYSDSLLKILNGKKAFEADFVHGMITRAFLLIEMHRYSEALICLYEAKRLAEKSGNPCSITELNLFLGDVLYKQEKYTEALEHFRNAHEAMKGCTDPNFSTAFVPVQAMLNSLGLAFEKTGQPDSAIFYYTKGIRFTDSCEKIYPKHLNFIQTARAVISGNLGHAEMSLGRYEQAEKHFLESVRINSRPGFDYSDALLNSIKLGHLYLITGKPKHTAGILKEADSILSAVHFPLGSLRYHHLRWQYFVERQDTGAAYHAYLDYSAVKMRMDSMQRELPGASLTQAFFNLSQRDKLNSLMESDKTKSRYLWLAGAFSLTLATILYLIRKNLRASRQSVAKLNALNSEIQAQNIQLRETLDALESSQEENRRLLRTVAHDLRSPVGAIVNLSAILLADRQITPEQQEQLRMIHSLGKDSLELMSELLNLKSSLQNLEKSPEDLFGILNYSTGLMQLTATQKQQHIRLSGNSLVMPLHREKIQRVLNNLLSNAIKFSAVGAEIEVELKALPGMARIEVRDRGIGIPEEWQEKLFSMDPGTSRSGTLGEQAFGLGLAIARQIVEAHGGQIGYEARSGGGSCFYVELER